MPSPLSDLTAGFLAKLEAEALPAIDKVTIPLYGVQDDEVKHDRTGVLYRVADYHFILTAAHDLRDIVTGEIPLYVRYSDGPELPVPLNKAVFHATEEDGRDVAAIRLMDDVIEKLAPHKSFLQHCAVAYDDRGRRGLYIIFGYPQAWFRLRRAESQSHPGLAFLCRPFTGEVNPDGHNDPDVHIVLGLDQNAVSVEDGSPQQVPSIKGLSGCGIWRVADVSGEGIRGWSRGELRLVALQHRWSSKRKYVRGTWIRYALQLIVANYPDLRRSMSLVYPRR